MGGSQPPHELFDEAAQDKQQRFQRLDLELKVHRRFLADGAGEQPHRATTCKGLAGGHASYAVTEHVSAFFHIENVTNTSYQEVYGYPALTRGFFGGLAVHY